MEIAKNKFVLKDGKFVPATPEDLGPDTKTIIVASREELRQNIASHTREGWTLVEESDDKAKFKNEFPVLMETTPHMMQQKLPAFVEIKLEQ